MQFPTHSREQVIGLDSIVRFRNGATNAIIVSALAILGFVAGAWVLSNPKKQPPNPKKQPPETQSEQDAPVTKANEKKLYAVTIRKPEGPPRAFLRSNNIHGNPVSVACSICHATRKPNFANKTVADMNEFHGSLAFSHGSVSCLSCHNSTDYDALKLADGTRVEFKDVMTLCAQCHGPQMRDYEHGTHGGFNGYWDLTRGPREKNNCIDCHHPHSPQFPKMQPTFKPRDRFLGKDSHESHE